MNSCEICFPGFDARASRGMIRWELFLDWDVRDVLETPHADTLQVVFRGDPDPAAWRAHLTAAGFPEPIIGQPADAAIETGPAAA